MALVHLVDRWLGVGERIFLVLANVCLATMLVFNIINIASRAVFDIGITFIFPWSVVLFVWMTFFGFFVIYRRRKDITVDFLIDRMGPRAKLFTRLVVNAIVLCLMSVMLYYAPYTLRAQIGEIDMVTIFGFLVERYVMSVPLFTACTLICLNVLVDTAHALHGDTEPRHSPAGDI